VHGKLFLGLNSHGRFFYNNKHILLNPLGKYFPQCSVRHSKQTKPHTHFQDHSRHVQMQGGTTGKVSGNNGSLPISDQIKTCLGHFFEKKSVHPPSKKKSKKKVLASRQCLDLWKRQRRCDCKRTALLGPNQPSMHITETSRTQPCYVTCRSGNVDPI
jgi:hypothetical protein